MPPLMEYSIVLRDLFASHVSSCIVCELYQGEQAMWFRQMAATSVAQQSWCGVAAHIQEHDRDPAALCISVLSLTFAISKVIHGSATSLSSSCSLHPTFHHTPFSAMQKLAT